MSQDLPAAASASAVGPRELRERPIQLRGNRLARWVLACFGWQIEFDGLPTAQGVVAVYPHTSNWDFPVGLFTKWALGLPFGFWGKESLFKYPLIGRWMRYVGGIPVRRNAPQGQVGAMAQSLRDAGSEGRTVWLVVAPEGTRSLTEGWKSGFYRVAHAADVPVALVAMDWGRKRVRFDSYWQLSGDAEADMAVFAQRLAQDRGCNPENASPVRMTGERAGRQPRI